MPFNLLPEVPGIAPPAVPLPSIPGYGVSGHGLAGRELPVLSPEQEQSLISELGSGALGAFETAGNVLDTLGAGVRDLIAGEGWNTVGNVFNPEQRTSGRDLLEQWGIVGPNQEGLDWGDAAGFLTEVALDPLTYLTLGGSALAKAGQVAKHAGLLGDLAKVTGKGVGSRVGRMRTTLGELVQAGGSDALERATRAAESMGLDVNTLMDQKLGGLIGVGLPFRDPAFVLGTMARNAPPRTPGGVPLRGFAERVADVFDRGEDVLRYGRIPGTNYSPGMQLSRLFDASVMETNTETGQRAARELFAKQNEGRAQARGVIADMANELKQQNVLDPDDVDALRRMFEGLDAPPAELQRMFDTATAELSKMKPQADAIGLKLNELVDPEIGYFPRYLSDFAEQGKSNKVFSTFDPSQLRRKEFLRGIDGGTARIRDIARDDALNQLIDQGASAKRIAQYLDRTYGNLWPKVTREVADPNGGVMHVPLTPKQIRSQHLKLAKFLADLPPEARQVGVFGNHPLLDLQVRLQNYNDAVAAGETVLDVLADPDVLQAASASARNVGTVKLSSVLRSLGFRTGDEANGALKALAERMGIQTIDQAAIKQVGSMRISRELADDLGRLMTGFKSPQPVSEIMQVVDSFTNLFKGAVTSPWPAFHVRNLLSGQYQNWISGQFSAKSFGQANAVLRGQEIDATDIPIVRQMLTDRGLPIDKANATRMLRELAYQHEIIGRHTGEIGSRVGAGVAEGNQFSDLLAEIPGENPVSLRTAGRKLIGAADGTSWNPFEMRGVNARVETRFAPAAAGQDLGHYVEGLNRLSPFIHQLRKGVDPSEAAGRVKAAQIDYSGRNYTEFERRAIHRVFPFAKFTKGVVPYTLRQVWEHPGGKLAQTIRGVNELRGDTEGPVPDYISDTAAIDVPAERPEDLRFVTGLGLMFEDPLSFLGENPLMELASRANPLIKGPLEYMTGQSFFQTGPRGGRPLEDMDPIIGRTLSNLLGRDEPVQLPGESIIEPLLANSPLARLATTARTLTDPRKGWGATLFNLGTGVRITDVPEYVRDRMVRELAERQLRQNPAVREFSRTYVPEGYEMLLAPHEWELMALLHQMRRRNAED